MTHNASRSSSRLARERAGFPKKTSDGSCCWAVGYSINTTRNTYSLKGTIFQLELLNGIPRGLVGGNLLLTDSLEVSAWASRGEKRR